jgi:hypothetical protein
LRAADADAAGRDARTRRLQARHRQRRVHAEQVGKSRGEAEHGDAVVAGAVTRHDLLRGQARMRGDGFQVRPVLAAVAHGNVDDAFGGRQHRRIGPECLRVQPAFDLLQRIPICG